MPFNDSLLALLLAAQDSTSRQSALENIFAERIQPLINRIIDGYRAPRINIEDARDIGATVALAVLRKLHRVAQRTDAVEDLERYVSTATYNAIYDSLRSRHPERMRLKNRVRYILEHDSHFAKWQVRGETVCGFASWEGSLPIASLRVPETIELSKYDRRGLSAALHEMFRATGRAIQLDDVIDAFATSWFGEEGADNDLGMENLPLAGGNAIVDLESRETLNAVWREVLELPPNQAIALLMNLRDLAGANAVALVVMTGVATLQEVASAMRISTDRLTTIWNDLPFDDMRIADMLNLTRQQVINLRKSARDRLRRRLSAFYRRSRE